MLRRLIGEDIELAIALAPTLGAVHGRPGPVEQVVMNLVVNARDAMPGGGSSRSRPRDVDLDEQLRRARTRTWPPGAYVMLAVSDTGIGMDAATSRRASSSRSSRPRSRARAPGLGLSTVYGIVKQSGGYDLGLQRAGRGHDVQGLPAASSAEPGSRGRAAAAPDVAPASGTLLLVEDHEQRADARARAAREAGLRRPRRGARRRGARPRRPRATAPDRAHHRRPPSCRASTGRSWPAA